MPADAAGPRGARAGRLAGSLLHLSFSCRRLELCERGEMNARVLKPFTEACRYMPGGVKSPVRAFRGVGGEPIFIARASGARVYDTAGKGYIDYVGSWGPMILGHAHPDVVRAVQ